MPLPVRRRRVLALAVGLLSIVACAQMGGEKFDEAIAIFRRNVELYAGSANVYDSLGEGYENAGKLELATQNFQKAIEVGTKADDPNLSDYKGHLKRVTDEAKAAGKSGGHK